MLVCCRRRWVVHGVCMNLCLKGEFFVVDGMCCVGIWRWDGVEGSTVSWYDNDVFCTGWGCTPGTRSYIQCLTYLIRFYRKVHAMSHAMLCSVRRPFSVVYMCVIQSLQRDIGYIYCTWEFIVYYSVLHPPHHKVRAKDRNVRLAMNGLVKVKKNCRSTISELIIKVSGFAISGLRQN